MAARIRDELSRALDLGRLLLDDIDGTVSSEDWFALSEHLREGAWQIGSATYCPGEWAEPDDAAADVESFDRARQALRPRLEALAALSPR